MQRTQHRSVFTALGLVTTLAFAACQGLDDRKVVRGTEDGNGGDDSSNGNAGDGPSGGGSQNLGGGDDPGNNPFGGDNSGGVPSVDGPPEVVDVDPAADADDAEPNGSVSLLFSEALDEATVTSDNIKISLGEQEVEGDLSYDKGVATFEPASRLALLGEYDVTVSDGVTDTSGQALKEAFSSKFTVREGEWAAEASVLPTPESWGGEHATAMDAAGNLLVAYARITDAANNKKSVFARWLRPDKAPGAEVELETNGLGGYHLEVAVDDDGNAIVVWQTSDPNGQATLRGRRYVNGAWEAEPQNVAQESAADPMQNAEYCAVAIGGGQIAVVWTRYYYNASVPTYVLNLTSAPLEGAWQAKPLTPYTVTNNSPKYESFSNVQATVDARGTALATFVWQSSTGTYKGVYYARKSLDAEWEYPNKIPSSPVPSSSGAGPLLASDGEGAMAVWVEYDAQYNYHLWASRYTRANQFAAPVQISDPLVTGNLQLARKGALAENGQSYWVTWTQGLGNSDNTYALRYDVATSAWDAKPTLISDGVIQSDDAVVGVDALGNALVAFDQPGASKTILVMGSRYVASSGKWADAEPLTAAGTYFGSPLLTMSSNGVASVFYSSSRNEGMPAAKNLGGYYRLFR